MLRRALYSVLSSSGGGGGLGAAVFPAAAALQLLPPPPPRAAARRAFAAAAAEVTAATPVERAIADKIAGGLPGARAVRVEDTSGGCGTMYAIEVTAADFEGLMKIKQHQLVAKLIADDVKQWHGFQLVTKTP